MPRDYYQLFSLAGQGMPRLRPHGERGDLMVTVRVELPTHLGEREKDLFRELKAIRSSRKV